MSEDWSFRFSLPNTPKGKQVSAEEAEIILLDLLKKHEQNWHDAMWELARFYSITGRQQIALGYVERLITNTDDLEKKATYLLAMGQLMEQQQNFEAAISFYSKAFALEPMNTPTWYLINNNLGYCLNYFERFAQAEAYCRAAIEINPLRHNAYKNLGMSLEGQKKFAGAARSYIAAVQPNASDIRAFHLLEKLVAEHIELPLEIPDIAKQLQNCREAVRIAASI